MNEEYFLRTHGIYIGYIFSMVYDGNYTTYTFYTDFKAKKSAGDHQLSTDVKLPTNAPVSDDDISKAFVESLSKKICLDIKCNSKEYVECMKTLPRGFFTEANAECVLEKTRNFLLEGKSKMSKEMIKNFGIRYDTACSDLMEYAHTQNHNVRKGTGREHIGE